jgi:4a-hydroxytetrahydrobiopterin dehydratase
MFKEENQKLMASITCKNFMDAVDKVNRIATVAEEMNHHPNLKIHSYKMLEIEIFTHSTNSISEKDFLLADAITALLAN